MLATQSQNEVQQELLARLDQARLQTDRLLRPGKARVPLRTSDSGAAPHYFLCRPSGGV